MRNQSRWTWRYPIQFEPRIRYKRNNWPPNQARSIDVWIFYSKVKWGVIRFHPKIILSIFQLLKVREDKYGCTDSTSGVITTPSDYDKINPPNLNNPGNLQNIITNCGTMTLEDLTKCKCTYVGQTTRKSQDNLSLFE